MNIKIFTLAIFLLLLVGCQKYGLAVEFPKNYTIKDKYVVHYEKEPLKMPSTKAIIMKGGKLDLSSVVSDKLSLEFREFDILLVPDKIDDKYFYRYLIFQPKDYHNDYTVEFELSPDGRPLKETIIQQSNGMIIGGNELIYRR